MSKKTTVVVSGCFDILHPGHTRLLQYAAGLGDYLIVLVNSDKSIREIKGEHKPYMACRDRMELLKAITGVYQVLEFDGEQDLLHLLKYLAPDVRVVGEEYRHKTVTGRHYSRRIEFFPIQDGHSSTYYAKRIADAQRQPDCA